MEFLQLDIDKLTPSAVIKTNLGEMTLALLFYTFNMIL